MLDPDASTPVHSGVMASHVMPGQLVALRPASQWLMAELIRLGLPSRWRFNMDLCAHEALTNIIEHAFAETADHFITLKLLRIGDDLALEIEDDGALFNPLRRPAHTQSASVIDAPIGGLGVDIIRSFMDDCRYEERDGRNVLTLLAHGVFPVSKETEGQISPQRNP